MFSYKLYSAMFGASRVSVMMQPVVILAIMLIMGPDLVTQPVHGHVYQDILITLQIMLPAFLKALIRQTPLLI